VRLRFLHPVEKDSSSFCRDITENTDSRNDIVPMPPTPIFSPPCTIPNTPIQINSISTSPLDTPAQEKEKRYTLPNHPSPRFTPFTAPWVAARLKDDPDRAIPILRNWAHPKRYREINQQTINEINLLRDGDAIDALTELQSPRVFKRGEKGLKLNLKTTIVTLNNRTEYTADALIDSGCEGSCIDVKYVRKNGLVTTKLARPIPVHNADGQPNSEGPISESVTLELRIGTHWERIDFGVTNLGKGEIFLGYDWLKLHNPNIDWQQGSVEFSRCPSRCQPHTHARSMDFDFEDDEEEQEEIDLQYILNDGDQLLMIDPTPALNIRASSNIAMDLAIKANEKKQKKEWTEVGTKIPTRLCRRFHETRLR
jgi:Retroviral aspartyl protease.